MTIRFKRLHHIGIAVPDLDSGSAIWGEAGLGLTEEGREDVVQARTRVAMFPVGDSRIELLEPMGEDSPVGKFLQKRGPGIHHLCFEVDDLQGKLDMLAEKGTRLIDRTPRQGLAGMIAFLHPRSTRGVLVELVDRDTVGR